MVAASTVQPSDGDESAIGARTDPPARSAPAAGSVGASPRRGVRGAKRRVFAVVFAVAVAPDRMWISPKDGRPGVSWGKDTVGHLEHGDFVL